MNAQAAEFHCWYAASREEALRKGESLWAVYHRFLRDAPIVDLGCGEGAFLLLLKEKGHSRLLGVDSSAELCQRAESFGVPVEHADLLEFLRAKKLEPAVYLYLDVVEHATFEFNVEVFRSLPVGSRLVIQTPNTNSVLGHQFYMQVPSHVAPYSPRVIHEMLERCGYSLVAEGTVTGEHPPTWKNRLRAYLIRKVLGVEPEVLHGGGNYYAVADRVRET